MIRDGEYSVRVRCRIVNRKVELLGDLPISVEEQELLREGMQAMVDDDEDATKSFLCKKEETMHVKIDGKRVVVDLKTEDEAIEFVRDLIGPITAEDLARLIKQLEEKGLKLEGKAQ